MPNATNFRQNNFDLIELLASIQVFHIHGLASFKLVLSLVFTEILGWLLGVPIFVVMSGLLVTHSFIRLASLKQYLFNGALRIFPGPWVYLLVSFLFSACQGDLEKKALFLKAIIWTGLCGAFFRKVRLNRQFYIAVPVREFASK